MQSTIVGWLASQFPLLSDISGPDQPGLVHRLDRDTSGIFICAYDNPTHLALQKQIAEKELVRKYLAWVVGQCTGDTWLDAIERAGRQKMRARKENLIDTLGITYNKPHHTLRPTNHRMGRHPHLEQGHRNFTKHAAMTVTPYRQYSNSTILTCQLHSGVQHQIRCQCSAHGHPIFGDPLYGRRNINPASERHGMLLHAHLLEFTDPWSGVRVDVINLPPWAA